MRSRKFETQLAKEVRELLASRAYWLMLLIIGPLAGNAFITAVNTYAEASGIGGGPAALAQGLTPLDGILVPTFGAYDLAVTLLFPFVAIRMVAAEKESGAWKLMLQTGASIGTMLAAKGLALIGGWIIAWIPGLLAIFLWKVYGGTVYAPETLNLLFGHLLRMFLASGVAVAAAAVANSASSAAIATLGFTVGTWALDFLAAGRGGIAQKVAAHTPTAALRIFEQGQLRLSTALVTLALGLAGFTFASIWLDMGRTLRSRIIRTLAACAGLGVLVWCFSLPRASWDVSENRRNSFSESDEAALKQIRDPLKIRVFLAPEDPRLMDLDRGILSKLQRVLPSVDIQYAAHSQAGLFEQPGSHYGEVWYEIRGRSSMSRSTTEAVVLETIYELARVAPPAHAEESEFAGHTLTARPFGAGFIYYLLWPACILLGWGYRFRNRRRAVVR